MMQKRVAVGSEMVFLSAVELARCMRAREFSATEVLEAHLDQIAGHGRRRPEQRIRIPRPPDLSQAPTVPPAPEISAA